MTGARLVLGEYHGRVLSVLVVRGPYDDGAVRDLDPEPDDGLVGCGDPSHPRFDPRDRCALCDAEALEDHLREQGDLHRDPLEDGPLDASPFEAPDDPPIEDPPEPDHDAEVEAAEQPPKIAMPTRRPRRP
jgi:hypothetical protein